MSEPEMMQMSAPDIFRTVSDMREAVAAWKAQGLKVGLVPTMGSLHDGHLSLVNKMARHADRLIVSIFVNPTQFAAHEDLDTYPRQEASDIAALAQTGAAQEARIAVYMPSVAEIYPTGFATSINVGGVADGLESAERPHFFGGVALVVHKLFAQSQADIAIFGEKDYQQLLVIRQMVRDLDVPMEILSGAIIREADGLAMSSRNAYLSPAQRLIAGQLNLILAQLANSNDTPEAASAQAHAALMEAGFSAVDYACLRHADTLAAIQTGDTVARRALIAARIGDIRLLDNMAARS
jgi:pantoate--beta-alanine ligase